MTIRGRAEHFAGDGVNQVTALQDGERRRLRSPSGRRGAAEKSAAEQRSAEQRVAEQRAAERRTADGCSGAQCRARNARIGVAGSNGRFRIISSGFFIR